MTDFMFAVARCHAVASSVKVERIKMQQNAPVKQPNIECTNHKSTRIETTNCITKTFVFVRLSHKRHKPAASDGVDCSQMTTKMMTATFVRSKEATNQSNVSSVIGHKSYHTTDGCMQPVYTVR